MKEKKLFAIYRIPNTHIGNVRANSKKNAIRIYMHDANSSCENRYYATIAIKGKHY